jgi:hypothetical protein
MKDEKLRSWGVPGPSPYKIGDKIICKDSTNTKALSEGMIYTVKAPETYGFVSVEGIGGGWFYDRFNLVTSFQEGKELSRSDTERLDKLEAQMDRVIRNIWAGKAHLNDVLALGDKPPRQKPKRRIEIAKD